MVIKKLRIRGERHSSTCRFLDQRPISDNIRYLINLSTLRKSLNQFGYSDLSLNKSVADDNLWIERLSLIPISAVKNYT
jgi:hypothetical protein